MQGSSRFGSKCRRLVVLGVALVCAAGTDAADFTASNASDAGAGSLRQAIEDANSSEETQNRVVFSPPNPGTIQLTAPFPSVTQDLTIEGGATTPADLRVQGTGAGSVVYEVDASRTLTLTDAPLALGDIVLGAGSTVAFDTTADQTVDSVIREVEGSVGALRKQGEGELRLTGENAYSGSTTIAEGTLVITNTASGTSLPGATAIEGPGTLAFDADDGTFALTSQIVGDGGLEKRGNSTLRLEGNNSYSGITRVLAGRLVGAPLNVPGDLDIAAGASAELSGALADGELFEGVITGAGTLEKSGTGKLSLDATNDIGRIDILAGTLAGDAAGLGAGEISVAESASLEFTEAGGETLAANLTGAGTVVKTGAGNARLSGINSVASLQIDGGRLIATRAASVPGAVTIAQAATLTFNPTEDGTYTGSIGGAGSIEKRGARSLTLAGTHSYTGGTELRVGALDITGSLTSDVTTLAGTTLSGSGRIDGSVAVDGTLAVSPGRELSVASLTLAENTILDATVAPDLAETLLDVDGTATLDPTAEFELTLVAGDYASAGQTFTIVRAGTLTGMPSAGLSALRYDLTLFQQGDELRLEVVPNNALFEDFATNRNQASVARSLDIEEPTATADMQLVLETIGALSSGAGEAYDALSGEQMSQLATVRLALANRLDRSLFTRLREAGDVLSPGGSTGVTAKSGFSPNSWIEPFATFGDIDGRQGAHATEYTLSGFSLGTDLSPAAGLRLGAAFTYGHGKLETRMLGGSAETNSFLAALYGGWSGRWLRLGLTSRIGYSDMKSDRRIRISTLDRTARADFDGLEAGGRFEAGARVFQRESFLVEPFINASYTFLSRSRIDERGADSVNLHISRDELNTAAVGAGLRLRANFELVDGLRLIPEIHSQWSQQLADRDRRLEGAFQDAIAGSKLRIYGTELHRNAGLTGVAWTVRSPNGLEARFGYDIGYDTDRVAQSVSVSATAWW